jgi:hypothetical protein
MVLEIRVPMAATVQMILAMLPLDVNTVLLDVLMGSFVQLILVKTVGDVCALLSLVKTLMFALLTTVMSQLEIVITMEFLRRVNCDASVTTVEMVCDHLPKTFCIFLKKHFEIMEILEFCFQSMIHHVSFT